MTRLVGAPPTDPQDAATKAYVDAILGATSPLTGATVAGELGGEVVFGDGNTPLATGGTASITGGDSGGGDLGAAVIAGGGDGGPYNSPGFVRIRTQGTFGTDYQMLTGNTVGGLVMWRDLASIAIVRFAAGVPTGNPLLNELPIAFDSTAVTGGVYYWTGAAWIKGSSLGSSGSFLSVAKWT